MNASFPGVIPAMGLAAVLACAACSAPPKIGNCGVDATADADITEQGPFNIGFKRFPITYQPPGDNPRTIMMNIWYPTKDKTGTGVTYANVFPDPQSWEDASLAPPLSSCGYPTIEYSHGYEGVGGGAAYMMRHFASHGWVALSADHTDNRLGDPQPPPNTIYYERSLDMSQVLDQAENLRPEDPLHGKIATDKVMLVGHSFGTHTVWSSAGATYDTTLIQGDETDAGTPFPADQLAVFQKGLRDPRVVAGIPMAGTLERSWFGPSGETSVHIPLLQMTGSANNVGQSPEEFMGLKNSPMTWIDLQGACHESFNLAQWDPCVPPATLDAQTGYKIVRTYAMAFARYHVLGDRSALVTGIVNGTTQVSPLVDVFMEH
jgi:predicted dienelactone hydrolase